MTRVSTKVTILHKHLSKRLSQHRKFTMLALLHVLSLSNQQEKEINSIWNAQNDNKNEGGKVSKIADGETLNEICDCVMPPKLYQHSRGFYDSK